MAQYMLIIYGDNETRGLSPEELQRMTEEYVVWAKEMGAAGKMLGANRLVEDSKIVSASGAQTIVRDGPFAETKEAIGGYFMISAETEDEAIAIAARCPGLKRTGEVRVQKIMEM